MAARDARRYRRAGLRGSARWLRDALVERGVAGRTLLEVGGGVGAIQIDLLEAGAARTTNVEMIDTYEHEAERLIGERGLADRVERLVADFAARPEVAPDAEVVVLHRVICCYPDVEAMVAAACDHARQVVAITVPRERWWVRLAFSSMNGWLRVRRVAFRGYVHPHERILEAAAARGFGRERSDTGAVWESMILTRGAG